MARTLITKTQAPLSFPTAGVAVTWTDADASNNNQFLMTADDLLLARNAHASAAKTVTVNSSADQQGRTLDITAQSIVAGKVYMFGPFTNKVGWVQTGGYLFCTAEDNNIKFAVIKLTAA